MLFLSKYKKNFFFIFAFLVFGIFVTIYDKFINETFYNYNFFYKSNVLDFYFFRDHFQLLATSHQYFIFFDLAIAILLVNFIYNKIYLFEKNKKLIPHLKIIWIFKVLFILCLFAVYEKTLLLDQNMFFFVAINNFETIEPFSYKSKYISDYPSSYFVVNIIKFLNLFFYKSWYCLKVTMSFFYLVTIIYSFKIINLFTKTNKVYFIYILSLLPSLIYSSSLIAKDILILPAITILFYSFFKLALYKKNYNKNLLIIIFCLIYISFIRNWISIACLVSISFYPIYLLLNRAKKLIVIEKYNTIKLTIYSCLALILFLVVFDLIINKHSYLQYQIYDSFRNYKVNENYNTGLHLFNKVESYHTFFIKIPIFYFYSIFNPFLEKIFEPKYLILIIENLLFIILIFTSIYKSDLKNKKIIFLTFVPYLIIFMSLYMFISYMNVGTGFRYAIQAKLPILLILLILNKKRIEKLFFFLKNIIKN